MYRNKLLFVYLCRTFVSNKKKNYEKMRLEDTRNMLRMYLEGCNQLHIMRNIYK